MDRSERIRTYNYPQNRITDHRIGYTAYNLDLALAGDLDGVLDALAEADRDRPAGRRHRADPPLTVRRQSGDTGTAPAPVDPVRSAGAGAGLGAEHLPVGDARTRRRARRAAPCRCR